MRAAASRDKGTEPRDDCPAAVLDEEEHSRLRNRLGAGVVGYLLLADSHTFIWGAREHAFVDVGVSE